MKLLRKSFSIALALLWCYTLWLPTAALAAPSMTKKEEGEIGREATSRIKESYRFVDDPYVTGYIASLVETLTVGMNAKEFKVQVHVMDSPMVNAFAIPGGYLFLTTGVIKAMEDEEELAGVIAHEMGHAEGRHIAYRSEKAGAMNWATLGALLAAVAAGAMGQPDVAMAVSAFGLAGVQAKMLQYSRADEEDADRRGLAALKGAGYSGWGLVRFMDTLRRRSAVPEDYPAYMMTHPVPAARSTRLASSLENGGASSAPDPFRGYFYLLKARLVSLDTDQWALDHYTSEADKSSGDFSRQLAAAIVLRGGARHSRALKYLDLCDKLLPGNVEATHERALVEMHSGGFPKGLARLETLLAGGNADEAVLRTLGWAYLESNRADEALRVYDYLAKRKVRWAKLQYQRALALGKVGREPEAHLELARYWRKLAPGLSLKHYKQALETLPEGAMRQAATREQEETRKSAEEAARKNK